MLLLPTALATPDALSGDDPHLVWHVEGPADSYFGSAVSGLHDIDGDSADDVIAGAVSYRGEGGTFVLSGATGADLFRARGEPGSLQGYHVADVGDVDGDGLHDVGTGGPAVGGGAAWVYSGSSRGVDVVEVLRVDGETEGDQLGSAVAGPGDVDGDGLADLAVGAASAGGTGAVLLYAGGVQVRAWHGDGDGAQLGGGLDLVGDLTGDGVAELAVGAPGLDGGAVYVIDPTAEGFHAGPLRGDDGSAALGLYFVGSPGDLDGDEVPDVFAGDFGARRGRGAAWVWSGADGALLLHVEGGPGDGLGCGRGAGDLDGDGVPDLALGSYASSEGAKLGGASGVYSGVDGDPLLYLVNTTAGENFGFDTVGLGDVNGDRRRDVLVSGATTAQLYLVSGPPLPPEAAEDPADDTAAPDGTEGDQPCGCATASVPSGGLLLVGAWRRRRRVAD